MVNGIMLMKGRVEMYNDDFVSNFTIRLRKRLRKAKNPNEERKRAIQNIVEKTFEQIHDKLYKEEIEIKSTADLDRLVKLSQLLDGEPTEIVKNEAEEMAEIDIQEIREELPEDFEEFEKKLLETLNQRNVKKQIGGGHE